VQLPDGADDALLQLLFVLDRQHYQFVPVTPETHAYAIARPSWSVARDLRGIFGWSLPFAADVPPPEVLDLLERAGALERDGGLFKSKLRVARLHGKLILHSAYPTIDEEAVFLGPDSYRFADFIRAELIRRPGIRRLVDIGAGAGAGALAAASLLPGARLTLCDLNAHALRLARINARHAGLTLESVCGDLDAVAGAFDAAIANPPFMIDEKSRTYRDGGDMHGARLSLDWAIEALDRLDPGGIMLLYTGSAIVEGRDELRAALERETAARGAGLRYREIDPDIYGEELEKPAYADVERIAAIGAVIEAAA